MKVALCFKPAHSGYVRKIHLVVLVVLLLVGQALNAQTLSGSVRGTVLELDGTRGISKVNVILFQPDSSWSTSTDSSGEFSFQNIPVGRYNISLSHLGYQSNVIPDIVVSSGKELQLEARMEATAMEMDTVVIGASNPRGVPINEMATVSAISFDVEDTRKFAGSIDDPARMATAFAGVTNNPFISNNLISIRGNSPRGMVYHLEGIEIPNPNHFARIGSSGGSFTLFSPQLLRRSDFFMGSMPAEYGNSTSGVFDIYFRGGNRSKRFHTAQLGILGVDLSAEGPFQKGKKSTYLFNYRFFTFNLVRWFTGTRQVPTFQDVALKFDFPLGRAGKISTFILAGNSERTKALVEDSTQWEFDIDRQERILGSEMGIVGVSHVVPIGTSLTLRSTIAATHGMARDNQNFLNDSSYLQPTVRHEYRRQRFAGGSTLRFSRSPSFVFKTGFTVSASLHDYFFYRYARESLTETRIAENDGTTYNAQAFAQMKIRLLPRLSFLPGVRYTYFNLSSSQALEPRAGFNYQLNSNHSLGLGYGLHSRIEHFAIYMAEQTENGTGITRPNQDLDFLRSHHLSFGYNGALDANSRIRLETYYQYLFNVPVEVGGTYSVINLDELEELRFLKNEGYGRNYGVELGFQHFNAKGYYLMVNGNLFESHYRMSDTSVWLSSAYDFGYKANFLLGKEFKYGKKSGFNKVFGINGRFTFVGGQLVTPVDADSSKIIGWTVYDETSPFSVREKPLFIVDMTMRFRANHHKYSSEFAIQIKNMLQNAVPEYREYDPGLDEVITLKGASILPVLSYKIDF